MAAYFAYFDSWQEQQQDRVWKYAAPTSFSMDEDNLNNLKAYWCKAEQDGNLTLPLAGGTPSSATYNWSKLLVRNSEGEIKNLEDAKNYDWIKDDTLYYYNTTYGVLHNIDDSGYPYTKEHVNAWEGILIYSKQDNMTLLRRNT